MINHVEHSLTLPKDYPTILSMGAWFSNTLCLTVKNQAVISATIGHLNTPEACRQHEKIAREWLSALGEKPSAIAHDLHPDFHSSRFAAQLATELNVPLIGIQHHHAHLAAICAEHAMDEVVLGLALDGVGLGDDGSAWGGELLQVNGASYQRLGHLTPLSLPGGDRAAHEPWRMAAGVLHQLGQDAEITRRFAKQPAAPTVLAMLQRNLNCPKSSSMGRVFDAAAGLLGLCLTMEFDAQAAIMLEQAATLYIAKQGWPTVLKNGWQLSDELQLNLMPLLAYLAEEKNSSHGAAVFHATVAAALCDWVEHAVKQTGIYKVACGGGCFFNRLLLEQLKQHFNQSNIEILSPLRLPAGDASISLGQAWITEKSM
jgi:hydrogenase maturation protein HypF